MTRLIDADALKKHKVYSEERYEYVVPVYNIDNAPTVKVPENEVNCVLTMFGECSYNKTGCSDCEIKDKIRRAIKALEERPRGEWEIYKSPVNRYYHCPFCNMNSPDVSVYMKMNFCTNCGADMRGGTDNGTN